MSRRADDPYKRSLYSHEELAKSLQIRPNDKGTVADVVYDPETKRLKVVYEQN